MVRMSCIGVSSSFQKRTNRVDNIPGTKFSLHNVQLIVSTGIPSLDHFLGDGLTVGTVILVEEDKYGPYAKLLMKHFLAEGVVNNHDILLALGDELPHQILEDLPAVVTDKGSEDAIPYTPEDSEMKIAWRYQNLPKVGSSAGNQFGHQYNIKKKLDPELITKCSPITIDITSEDNHTCNNYSEQNFLSKPCFEIITAIQKLIKEKHLRIDQSNKPKNIFRIAIHSLGSPSWKKMDCSEKEWNCYLFKFLYLLKSIMRSAFAVALVTVPIDLIQNLVLLEQMELICDTVICLKSFVTSDNEVHPAFKQYNGLLDVKKVSSLNSLKSHIPDTDDLAFCIRKRSFIVEKFHLPPLLEETASRATESKKDKPHSGSLLCSSNRKKLLDF